MRKEMIESYIDNLRASLGRVRTPINEEQLRSLYNSRNYAGMIWHIKNHLALDLRVILGLANKGGPAAPAWVVRPSELPMFGTSSFRQLTITVYIRKSYLTVSCFEEVVCAIAHELSHVVLDAIRHQLRWQEEAVDLTAMLLGFRDFYVTGCRSVRDVSSQADTLAGLKVTQISTQGYLTHEEVGHAAMYMTYR